MQKRWLISVLALLLLPQPALAASARTLMVFWRDDCAPCRDELRILPEIAAQHPELQVWLMALHGTPPSPPAGVKLYDATGNGAQLLALYGDAQRAIPFSILLFEDGSVCEQHYGILGTDQVTQWVQTC